MGIRNVWFRDSADKPLYIETIPKEGYRFVAPVLEAGSHRQEPPRTGCFGQSIQQRTQCYANGCRGRI